MAATLARRLGDAVSGSSSSSANDSSRFLQMPKPLPRSTSPTSPSSSSPSPRASAAALMPQITCSTCGQGLSVEALATHVCSGTRSTTVEVSRSRSPAQSYQPSSSQATTSQRSRPEQVERLADPVSDDLDDDPYGGMQSPTTTSQGLPPTTTARTSPLSKVTPLPSLSSSRPAPENGRNRSGSSASSNAAQSLASSSSASRSRAASGRGGQPPVALTIDTRAAQRVPQQPPHFQHPQHETQRYEQQQQSPHPAGMMQGSTASSSSHLQPRPYPPQQSGGNMAGVGRRAFDAARSPISPAASSPIYPQFQLPPDQPQIDAHNQSQPFFLASHAEAYSRPGARADERLGGRPQPTRSATMTGLGIHAGGGGGGGGGYSSALPDTSVGAFGLPTLMPSRQAGASAKELHGHLHGRRSPQFGGGGGGHDGFDSDPASAGSSRPTSPLPPFGAHSGSGAGNPQFMGHAARDAGGRSMSASSTGSEPSQLLRPPQPIARPMPSRSMSESNASKPTPDVRTDVQRDSARSPSPLASGPSSAPNIADRPPPMARSPSPLATVEPPRPPAAAATASTAAANESARNAFWDRYKQQQTEANASQSTLQPVSASNASLSSSGTSTAETALRLLTPMASDDGLREASPAAKASEPIVVASPESETTPEHERGHSPSESVDMSRRTSTIAPSDSISSPGVADWPRKDPSAPPVPKLAAAPPPSSAASSTGSNAKRACHRCAGSLRGKKYVQRENGVKLCEDCFKEMFLPKCRRCHLAIEGRAISSGNGRMSGKLHPACFVCWDCDKPFNAADPESFYVWEAKPCCRDCYHQHNGTFCAGCKQPIEGACLVTPAGRYHPSHLVCDFERDCCNAMADYYQVGELKVCLEHVQAAVDRANRQGGQQAGATRAERRQTRLMQVERKSVVRD